MSLFKIGPSRAGCLLFGALALAGCDRKKDAPPPPVRPVLSLVIQPSTAQAGTSFIGTVEPRYQAQLGFQIAGRMISRDANVGERISRGQQLATLDPTVPRLALTSAQADLSNAQAQLRNAASTLSRQQELVKSESVSQAQVDAAVAARDSAQARVNQAQANLQKAQEQLNDTVLTSDYDGVVASFGAEVGQVVAASQTVVTVARPDARDAVFDIPDALIDRFKPGATFGVSLLANDSLNLQGKVREIAPQADAATRTRRVRLTLETPGEAFRLGTNVRLTLARQDESRLEIPPSAVLERDGKMKVWLVTSDSKAASREVALGERRDGNIVVTNGLAAGDRVIIAGVHSLTEGQPIKLSEPREEQK